MEQLRDLHIMHLPSWNMCGLPASSVLGLHGVGVTDASVGATSTGTVDFLCSSQELSS